MGILSTKILPLFVLVVIPIFVFIYLRLEGVRTHVELLPLAIICLVYGFYPLKYRDYFKKKGFGPAIIEYHLVKRILYIEIPLFIFFLAFYYTSFLVPSYLWPLSWLSFEIQAALQYSVMAGTLWLFCLTIKKDFRYYLTRAYVKTIPDNNDDVEKMNWLIMGLKAYNKYLLRIFRLQINTTKLYSTLIIESKVHISDRVKLISESFNDKDKLAPARRLSEIINGQKIEEFLAKPSKRDITWDTFAGVILPVVITILQLEHILPK
jgi:hypothetical protein